MTVGSSTITERSSTPALIPLHNTASGSLPQWAMIELNGNLVPPSLNAASRLSGKEKNPAQLASENGLVKKDQVELGSVRFVNKKPIMILGTHELEGKVETLKQPYCVLEKEASSSSGCGTSYRVSGIVTSKLLFDKYPKVILR